MSPELKTKLCQLPQEHCDLVMKGGITSGIVYPTAVLELAQRYRFRCIGGSSAGAIAAAGTAAAEYGRASGGFIRFQKLCEELAQPGRLLNLFQPEPSTKPAFDFFLQLLGVSDSKKHSLMGILTGAVIGRYVRYSLLTAIPLITVFNLIAWAANLFSAPAVGWHVVTIFLLGLLLGMIGGVYWTYRSLRNIARQMLQSIAANNLGLCTGLGTNDQEALTEFLHKSLNDLANLPSKNPLTFKHLKDRDIQLVVMASNLSLQRPYSFPMQTDVYLFKDDELSRFFPPEVMEALRKSSGGKEMPAPPTGYYYLPPNFELPVVVAVRMSLSFPLLFSAVPLYSIGEQFHHRRTQNAQTTLTADDLQRHYFSDGGIVTNFPIHLFDRWLPDCPTFGINLADLPERAFDKEDAQKTAATHSKQAAHSENGTEVEPAALARSFLTRQAPPPPSSTEGAPANSPSAPATAARTPSFDRHLSAVYLPRADDPPLREYKPLDAPPDVDDPLIPLVNLVKAIFYTAKNHRDNLQADLPSYRERIVTIRLHSTEGGMNLNMNQDVIKKIMERGRKAGSLLLKDFNFEHHRWVRFRVIMAHLERELMAMIETLRQEPYKVMIRDGNASGQPWPFQNGFDGNRALTYLEELCTTLETLTQKHQVTFDRDPPIPEPAKRLVPRD